MWNNHYHAFMRNPVHIFFVSIFCIFCFFGGRFVYEFFISEDISTLKYFESISKEPVQQNLSTKKPGIES